MGLYNIYFYIVKFLHFLYFCIPYSKFFISHSLFSLYTLAFETSCDDTSVALLRNSELIALSTRTQLEHESTGWVVPEVAARSHANAIFPCLEDVLSDANITLDQIDLIACTQKPGLLPSLLTGMTVAKTLSLDTDIPLVWVDHIEAHMFANLLGRSADDIIFPNIVLTVSGGHTELYLWKSLFEFELLGQTRDDAAGECFDKVAKMLGLGFPGGAKIAKYAQDYRDQHDEAILRQSAELFPRALFEKDSLEFSFSGLKSAIKRYIDTFETITEEQIQEISYATEEAITDVLVQKLFRAADMHQVKMICLAWGVSANSSLKQKISTQASMQGKIFLAPIKTVYSMDNAAMVGIRGYYEYQKRTSQIT